MESTARSESSEAALPYVTAVMHSSGARSTTAAKQMSFHGHNARHAVGCCVVGVAGISCGVVGGPPTGSPGDGMFPGVVGGTPMGSGCGVSGGAGGLIGAGLGSAGIGSG